MGKTIAAIPSVPRATYRLQFHKGFRFRDALGLVDYLSGLGISHVYASPLFQARAGSTHGYDVCDPTSINSEIGTEEELAKFSKKLREQGMGILLDVVPNHMGNDLSNQWWRDVLEHGRGSKYAGFFDIAWEALPEPWKGKVLAPVLGDRYARVLERGELKLGFAGGRFHIAYFDKQFPISPESNERLFKEMGKARSATAAQPVLKQYDVLQSKDAVHRMHGLLKTQHYRLAYWKVGPEQLNYRRFFDITDLIAMRVETPEVFEETHAYLFRLLERGIISGIRVDHPDGLWDPQGYFERVQKRYKKTSGHHGRLYVLAEKILSEGEQLPEDWAVAGTTGYDYLNVANGLFVNPRAEGRLTRFYQEFSGRTIGYKETVYRSKRQVLRSSFIGEMNTLRSQLKEIADGRMEGQDFTEQELGEALATVIGSFPVYRTYITAAEPKPSKAGLNYIREAIARAKRRSRMDDGVFDFLQGLLEGKGRKSERERLLNFILKWQQLSGPTMAKGLEDTAFYRYFRLASLNEVGGDPGKFGVSPEEFHDYNEHKQEDWPNSMLASATHDTKRGEDLRARLNVISELPEEWEPAVKSWAEMNQKYRGEAGPTRNDEYLFYQTVVGAWGQGSETGNGLASFRERVSAYMLKAVKEAKLETSWTERNEAYENAVTEFVKATLNEENQPFLRAVGKLNSRLGFFGYLNSLAQIILKLASPGVPDTYQGTELWDFSLVDPDNRRPVDFDQRKKVAKDLRGVSDLPAKAGELLSRMETGEIKLFLILLALQFRKEHQELFRDGNYVPLKATGPKADHVVAFAREHKKERVVVVVPRLIAGVTGGREVLPIGEGTWSGTALKAPRGEKWRNVLTGEEFESDNLSLGKILERLPVAILQSEG